MCKSRWMVAGTGTVLAAFAIAAGIGAVQAHQAEAPQLYNVEIVIFRTVTPLGVAEDWSAQKSREQLSDEETATEGAGTTPSAGDRVTIQPLSSAHFKLAGTDAALRRSSNYQVLAHVAWTQPATPRGSNGSTPLSELGVGDSTLRGSVALEQGRYLYLDFDLMWTPTDPPASLVGTTGSTAPVTFTLREKRRLRPFEQHYLDHPAFGVIAIVSPVN